MSKRKKTQQDDAGLAESSIESSSHSESVSGDMIDDNGGSTPFRLLTSYRRVI